MMLEVQKYLRSGKTLEDLNNELHISSVFHNTDPLVILNYNQLESPKANSIVRECRGLVLEKDSWKVVAKGFNRFFNWGELQEEQRFFNCHDFFGESKEDGSFVIFYYYGGRWRVNTRNSFAQDIMHFQDFTWEEAILKALDISSLDKLLLNQSFSYVCEFCSPWNKVVRRYPRPVLYLTGVFCVESPDFFELDVEECNIVSEYLNALRPDIYQFTDLDEVQEFIGEYATCDPTFEGIVIRDYKSRWKVKNPKYLSLHRMKGNNGENLFNPKNLLPFILDGESDELLTYFPEIKEYYLKCEDKVKRLKNEVFGLWNQYASVEDQKEFALGVKDHPLSAILFDARRQEDVDINKLFRQYDELILKRLKEKGT